MIKVLIVEDDPMVASINARFLKQIEGMVLTAAVPGLEEAKRVLTQEQPDLVLLDLFLPRESGMDLLKWIRAQDLSADVILITADKTSTIVQEAFRYGVVDYLIKPFTFDRFREALGRYLQRKEELEQKSALTQAELDELIQGGGTSADDHELEKGINKYTLQLILKALILHQEEPLSAEAIAESSGVATVTVRRYLNYMERSGQIERLVEYGKVGRPQHRYQLLPHMRSEI